MNNNNNYDDDDDGVFFLYVLFLICVLRLRDGNERAHIANPSNKEGEGLKEEVDEVAVLAVGQVVASTDEEIGSNAELRHMDSVHHQEQGMKWI